MTDLIAAVLRHHAPMRLVIRAAPVEAIETESECAFAPSQRGEDFDSGLDDFRADAVAWNGCDCVGLHGGFLVQNCIPCRIPRTAQTRPGEGFAGGH